MTGLAGVGDVAEPVIAAALHVHLRGE